MKSHSTIARLFSILLLLVLLASIPGVLEARSSPVPVGERLVFLAYGDTRPNLWPFGRQKKHHALTRAMISVDQALGGEVDGVLMSGDLIFADIPFTKLDWKPAHDALGQFLRAPHPLPVYPALGNHELVTLSKVDTDEATARLAEAMLHWGHDPTVPVAAGAELRPALLAGLPALLVPAVHATVSRFVTKLPARSELVFLCDQMDDGLGPIWARSAYQLEVGQVRSALRRLSLENVEADRIVAVLEAASPDLVLEWVRLLHEEGLGDAISRGHELGGWLTRALRPVGRHLGALGALADRARSRAERDWFAETSRSPRKGLTKSWRVFRDQLIRPLGRAMTHGTSLESLPFDELAVGPSWYFLDRPIPGTASSVRIVCLNTNLAHIAGVGGLPPEQDQVRFIVDAVKGHDGPIIILGHSPVVSVGQHGKGWASAGGDDPICATRRMLFDLVASQLSEVERRRIWCVISGHDHDYQRFVDTRHGTLFLVLGGGGVPLSPRGVPPSDEPALLDRVSREMHAQLSPSVTWLRAFHFAAIEIRDGRMEFKVYGVCDPVGEPLSDRALAEKLPPAIAGQLSQPARLIENVVLEGAGASGARVLEVVPASGCPAAGVGR